MESNLAEKEEAIRSGGTTASLNGTRRTTNSGADINASAEEMMVTDLDRSTITEDDEISDLHTSNDDDENDVAAKGEQRAFVESTATVLYSGPKAQEISLCFSGAANYVACPSSCFLLPSPSTYRLGPVLVLSQYRSNWYC
ncbi:hypothetical protein PIB30_046461 [Stylosanthes scabra]|uniref:Uncharacterized protein n=1 Tax=Stylosanthes scabra TaxID=79078 RepID=A0ABU6SGH6_9FABA|nr:hypothetical protein [Stylosanthes scabra]